MKPIHRLFTLALSLSLSLALSLCTFTGCATAPPSMPVQQKASLLQLDDQYWVGLTDVTEIAFNPAGDIRVWHRGNVDPFDFTFSDRFAAAKAWKKLVNQLGGSLSETDLKISPQPESMPTETANTKAPTQTLSKNPVTPEPVTIAPDDGPYSHLRQDLAALTTCRDEKLLTPGEYENARQRTITNFIKIYGNGNLYNCALGQLHAELADLQSAVKDHLMDANEIAALHASILNRYSITPE